MASDRELLSPLALCLEREIAIPFNLRVGISLRVTASDLNHLASACFVKPGCIAGCTVQAKEAG